MKKHVPDLAPPLQTAARMHRGLVRRGPSPMALEQRFMFDGAAALDAAATLDAGTDHLLEATRSAQAADVDAMELAPPALVAVGNAERNEVVFIVGDVADYQTLLDGLAPGTEVHVLDASQDGLAQIADILDGRSGIAAIHILSHGSQGEVRLGSASLNASNLSEYAATLARVGASLSETGDILVYGCAVADGAGGVEFVSRLALATSADVAASTDATGSARLGGDWVLEYQSGDVESALPFAAGASQWEGLLASVSQGGGTVQVNAIDTGSDGTATLTANSTNRYYYNIASSDRIEFTLADGRKFYLTDLSEGSWGSSSGGNVIGISSSANAGSSYTINIIAGAGYLATFDLYDGVSNVRLANDVVYSGSSFEPAWAFDYAAATGVLSLKVPSVTTGAIASDGTWVNSPSSYSTYGTYTLTSPAPTVTAVSASSSNGTYKTGDTIAATVQFSEAVNVIGTPQLTLETGSTDRAVNYASGSGTSTLTFNYTVQSGDTSADLDYLSTSALSLNGGTIRDADGNDATLTLASPGAANSLGANKAIVVDGVAPTFSSAATNTAGTKVILTYGEALSATTAASGAFAVTVGGSSASVSSVSVSGSTVELSLMSAVRYGQSVTVAYTDPTSGNDASAVQDAAGNDAASLASTSATNNARPNVMFDHAYQLFKSGSSTSFSANSTNPDIDPNSASSAVNGVYINSLRFVASAASTTASGTFQVQGNDVTGTLEFSGTIVNASGVSTTSSFTLVGAISKHDKNRDGYTGDSEAFYFFSSSNSDASLNGLGFLMITNGSESYFSNTETSISLPADTAYVDTLNAYLNQQSDTTPPTATISLADTALKAGETSVVTITFSEAVSGFTNADLTVANGTLTNVSSSDGGITWTATFTPTADIEDATNVITVANGGVTDAAGNAGSGSTSSANYTIDTLRPTASISLTDTALKVGETSLVTITFSEAVSGFTNADLSIANGTLSSVSSSDGGLTWTATFTPTANLEDTTNVITLANSGVTDAAGNAGSGSASSANYTIDTLRPTIAIASDKSSLKAGESATLTFTLSEAASDFAATDIAVSGGTLSGFTGSGTSYSASFTPDASSIAGGVISVASSKFSDAAGNANTDGADADNAVTLTIDTLRPTATISLADTALKAGETSVVTITFSEAVSGFTNADLTVANGTLSSVSSSDGGITWTATFTPTANLEDATNVITLANTGVTDAAGNAGSGTTDSSNYAIDTLRPTATISLADTALKVGDTSQVTITFSEAVSGFTNADLSIANGTLTTVSSSDGGVTWTATFTPTADIEDATNVITLANSSVTDAAGNAGSGSASSANYTIDTLRPTIAIASDKSSLKAGESATLTFTLSEAASDFTATDIAVSGGTLSGFTGSGTSYSASFTPDASSIADGVISVDSTKFADAAGNANADGADANNTVTLTVDTLRPTATISLADTALKAGDTSLVTITFSEAVSGFTNADLTVANGTLSTVSSSDSGVTWTATFTPTANLEDTTNVITLANTGVTDAAGNTGSGTTDSSNYSIDTLRPTATISLADTALKAGETSVVTITFSEAVSGFTNADLTVANGTLTNVSSSDGGITWTATFTPTADIEDATNVITLVNSGVTDAAGNAGSGSTSSANYTIDTLRPTASISLTDTALKVGETSLVTITFSEAVSGFTNADLSIANGTLSSVSSSDGGVTWTATFTPTANLEDTSNVITLANTGVTDAAGNAGSGTTDSSNYAIDTLRPTATISLADTALKVGDTSQVTITFSEAVSGFTNADLSIANGTLTTVSSSDGGVTWTATFTPTADIEDATNVITLANSSVTDAAGNAGSGSTSSANYTIDTLRPTIAIASDKSSLKAGESATLTFTLSEAASDFAASDIAVSGGTLSGFTGSGTSYSASFTPDASSIADGVISVASSKFSDAAGNANTDGADADNAVRLTVDTVIVTVSEPVVNEASPYAVFTVVGVQGQVMALALADGEATGGGTDFGAAGSGNLEVSLDGGSTWAAYGAAVTLPAGGAVLVRTPVVEDGLRDNNETFTLTTTPLAGTAASGRGTIRDDGTGSLFKEDGSIDAEAVGSDDRPVSVSSPRVNEASPHAVFSVTGAAGQRVRLALTAETASGDGVDFGASLQVSTDGGASWSSYVGAVALSAEGGLLVRTPVVDDGIADQGETFRLTATPVGGVAAEGRALLDDQGAGLVFGEDGSPDAEAVLDDERPLTVSSLTVSEASPYAVFTVTGAAGQRVGLALASGTATVGTDTGAALEYFDGTRWQAYVPGSLVTIPPGGGSLLVRVAIVNDNAFEGAESFQLRAHNTAGGLSTGVITVRDDGLSSDVFTADSLSGTPSAGAADDDMPKPLPPAATAAPEPAASLPPEPPAAPAQEPGPQVSNASADPAADAKAPATGFLPPSGELLTNASGFRVVVSEAPSPSLTVFRGITDQFVEGNRPTSFALPHDAFTHTRADAVVTLEARHADGTVLPPWVQFDARAGTFQIDPPAGFAGELQILVTARDSEGREARAMFRFHVGEAKLGALGRSSLSEQLRLAAKRPTPWLDLVRAQQAQRMAPREAPAARARA